MSRYERIDSPGREFSQPGLTILGGKDVACRIANPPQRRFSATTMDHKVRYYKYLNGTSASSFPWSLVPWVPASSVSHRFLRFPTARKLAIAARTGYSGSVANNCFLDSLTGARQIESDLQDRVACATLRKLEVSSGASQWPFGLPRVGSGKQVSS